MTLPSRHMGWFETRTLAVWDWARYISVTKAPLNIKWAEKKHCVSLKFGYQSGFWTRFLRFPKQAALTTPPSHNQKLGDEHCHVPWSCLLGHRLLTPNCLAPRLVYHYRPTFLSINLKSHSSINQPRRTIMPPWSIASFINKERAARGSVRKYRRYTGFNINSNKDISLKTQHRTSGIRTRDAGMTGEAICQSATAASLKLTVCMFNIYIAFIMMV